MLRSVYRSSHWRCSKKRVFLKISQNSEENTCAKSLFLNNVVGLNNTSGWLLLSISNDKFFMDWIRESINFKLNIPVCSHCVKNVKIRSLFWSIFSRIWTEYGEIRSISPYSVQMRENTDQQKLCIWTFFTRWHFSHGNILTRSNTVFPYINIISLFSWHRSIDPVWFAVYTHTM